MKLLSKKELETVNGGIHMFPILPVIITVVESLLSKDESKEENDGDD